MKYLTVLFDSECSICLRCRRWLMAQPSFIELRFLSLHTPDLAALFPGIDALKPDEQLLVVSDDGAVYRGPQAWVMCLYALQNYRAHALAWRIRRCCRGRGVPASCSLRVAT